MNFSDLTHPKQKGEAAEAIITGELLRRGIQCLKPVGDNLPFDLVVYNGREDKFIRLQCKTARKLQSSKSHAFCFNTNSSRTNTKHTYVTNYVGKIDYFLVFYPTTNKVYVINIDSNQSTLRIDQALNKQSKKINMAVDFELDKHLNLFL